MPEMVENESSGNSSLQDINIVEQIEYYFGDFNLMKDKFLKNEITKDEGWVSISTLLRFNRLAALTKDIDVIMSAFNKNPSSLVELNEERRCVRRNPNRAIPTHDETWRSTVAERSIYVKGFPLETATMDDILKFMSTFGKIDNVFKRSYFDKALKQWKFKGSVFVAFPTKEDAEKFMSIGSVKYAGNELIRKWQNDYIEFKKNERLKMKLEAKEMKNQLLKEQQEELQKDLKKLPKGALIALSGLNNDIHMHEIKEAATQLGWEIAFVDYSKGESTSYIRLQTENSAKDALAKLTDSSFEIKGVTVKAELVEGEQETKLLEKMEADKNSRIMQHLLKSKGKKGKNKRNKFGKYSRNGDADSKKNTDVDGEESKNVEENKSEVDTNHSEQGQSVEKMEEPESSSQGTHKRKNDDENSAEIAKKSKPDEK